MLTTVEAEIDTDGNVELLEPLVLKRKSRAIVTVLDDKNGSASKEVKGNRLRDLLADPTFRSRPSYPADVIDAQIKEARNSWD